MSVRGPLLHAPRLLRILHFQQHYGFLTKKKEQQKKKQLSSSTARVSSHILKYCSLVVSDILLCVYSWLWFLYFRLAVWTWQSDLTNLKVNRVLYQSKHCLRDSSNMLEVDNAGIFNSLKEMPSLWLGMHIYYLVMVLDSLFTLSSCLWVIMNPCSQTAFSGSISVENVSHILDTLLGPMDNKSL